MNNILIINQLLDQKCYTKHWTENRLLANYIYILFYTTYHVKTMPNFFFQIKELLLVTLFTEMIQFFKYKNKTMRMHFIENYRKLAWQSLVINLMHCHCTNKNFLLFCLTSLAAEEIATIENSLYFHYSSRDLFFFFVKLENLNWMNEHRDIITKPTSNVFDKSNLYKDDKNSNSKLSKNSSILPILLSRILFKHIFLFYQLISNTFFCFQLLSFICSETIMIDEANVDKLGKQKSN